MSLEVMAQREKMRAELEKAELTAERNTLLQGLVLSESERRKKVRNLVPGTLCSMPHAGVFPAAFFFPLIMVAEAVWQICLVRGLVLLYSCLVLG